MNEEQNFLIVILYDKIGAALRAKEMAERVAAEWESECDVWPFELLVGQRERDQAALRASKANMIIITAGGLDALPDGLKDWIETWLPHKTSGPSALVVLLDEKEPASAQSWRPLADLQRIARRGNMDFFCNLDRSRRGDETAADYPEQDVMAGREPAIDLAPSQARCSPPTGRGWSQHHTN